MAKIETRKERRRALKTMKKDNKALVRWQSESQKTNFLVEGESLLSDKARKKLLKEYKERVLWQARSDKKNILVAGEPLGHETSIKRKRKPPNK